MAKRSSVSRVAYPGQSSGTGPSASCGYCYSLPRGGLYSGKTLFIETKGVIGHRRPVSGAPSSGTPRESQAKFRHGTVWVLEKGPVGTGPSGSVFGENSFYRETRGTGRGGRHVAKRSSDPRVAYPEVKVQVRDLVRVVGIVAPFAPRGISIRG